MIVRIPLAFVALLLVATAVSAQTGPPEDGPDGFGYSYKDSRVADGPGGIYSTIIGTAGSTTIAQPGVDNDAQRTLPFGFDFYGTAYNNVYVHDNNFLSFDGPHTNCCFFPPTTMPSTDAADPGTMIAPLWDDGYWLGTAAVEEKTVGTAPFRNHIVEFDTCYDSGGAGLCPVIFQVHLLETFDAFEVWYDANIDPVPGYDFVPWVTGGIYGSTPRTGLTYHADVVGIPSGTVVQYRAPTSEPYNTDYTATMVEDDSNLLTGDVSTNAKQVGTVPILAYYVTDAPVNATGGNFTFNNATGAWSYTPDKDHFNGTDSFQFVVNDVWGNSSKHWVNITVTGLNDKPSFSDAGDVTSDEDEGRVWAENWAHDITTGPSPWEDYQMPNWNVTTDNDALFASLPEVRSNGTLTYKSAQDAHGEATITVHFVDDGNHDGTTEFNRTSDHTARITVNPIDDPPTANDDAWSTDEDATVSFDVLANDSDAPDAGETLTLVSVGSASNGLTARDAGTGLAVYTPHADFNGVDSFQVTIRDSNGTAANSTVTVTVNPVNDAPSMTASNVEVLEDSGIASIPVATFSPGPVDESGQSISLQTVNDNNALFSVQPVLDGAGNINFEPAADAFGSAIITVTLMDDGPGGAPHDNTTVQTFQLNVTPVNDAPSATVAGPFSAQWDAGPVTAPLLSGASAGPMETQALTYSIVADDSSFFADGPKISGTDLSFTPIDGVAGSTDIHITVSDGGGTANGGVNQTTYTTQVTVYAFNDPPVAVDDAWDFPEGVSALWVDPLTNDSDAESSFSFDVGGLDQPRDANGVVRGTATWESGSLRVSTHNGFVGDLTVVYRIVDQLGATDTANITLHVADPATPFLIFHNGAHDSTTDDAMLCAGVPGVWHVEGHFAGGAPASYHVDFGDGTSTTKATAADWIHVPKTYTAGSYVATATVTFTDGTTESEVRNLDVAACPVPAIEIFTNGRAVTFVDKSTDDGTIVSADWDLGDGTHLTGTGDKSHTFPSYGTYQVILTLVDDDGNQRTQAFIVNLVAPVFVDTVAPAANEQDADEEPEESEEPVAAPDKGNGVPTARIRTIEPVVTGNKVILDGSASSDPDRDALSYTWKQLTGYVVGLEGSGPAIGFTAPPLPTVLEFELTVSDGQATDTARVNVEIIAPAEPPKPDFKAAPANLDVRFEDLTDGTSPAATFTWHFGDGTTSNERAPVHTYDEPGLYFVRLVVEDAGRSRETMQSVFVAMPQTASNEGPEVAQVQVAPEPRVVETASAGQIGVLAGLGALVVGLLGAVIVVARRK